jgi:hypothetical protein
MITNSGWSTRPIPSLRRAKVAAGAGMKDLDHARQNFAPESPARDAPSTYHKARCVTR